MSLSDLLKRVIKAVSSNTAEDGLQEETFWKKQPDHIQILKKLTNFLRRPNGTYSSCMVLWRLSS